MENQSIEEIIPINVVTNIERAVAFYTEKLGFSISFKWREPIDYIILECQDRHIHLTLKKEKKPSIVYIIFNEVVKLYEKLKTKDVTITSELETLPWGMIEFEITDPDGNQLIFGEPVNHEKNE